MPNTVAERELDFYEQTGADSESFLGCSRAVAVCTREFESLVAEVLRRIVSLEGEVADVKADVRRMPSRCIVQFGPLALTLSWVRARPDRVLDGRLLIIEWQGTVARGSERIPERSLFANGNKPATILHENTLRARATSGDDWSWQQEGSKGGNFGSRDLAARCVDSLASNLMKRRKEVRAVTS